MATPARGSAKKSAPKSQVFLGRRRGFPGFPRAAARRNRNDRKSCGKIKFKNKAHDRDLAGI
jgi:hypothetical protein